MKPLYQLVSEYRELDHLDVEDIEPQTLADTLEALQGEIEVKATNVALFARNIETFADTVASAAEQMQSRADRLRNKAEGIRSYLLMQMKGAGITKIQSPQVSINVRKNPPAVIVKPDVVVPDEYMVQPPAPPKRVDCAKLAKDLKAGVAVDGCYLESGERLEIK